METKGKEYEPIFIPNQCSLILLSFQQTQEDYIPVLSSIQLGPHDCFLNNGMWTEVVYTILGTAYKIPY